MPIIEPANPIDCRQFVEAHSQEIISGVYDLRIQQEWIKELTPFVLKLISQHCSSSKRTIAENKDTPQDILDMLATGGSNSIKSYVASNPNTSSGTLDFLFRYYMANTNLRAQKRQFPPYCDETTLSIAYALSQNLYCPRSHLETLSKSEDDHIRAGVASNIKTPAAILAILAKDGEYIVRLAVAGNPNTPTSCLEILVEECNKKGVCTISLYESDIVNQLIRNPATPLKALLTMKHWRIQLANNSSVRKFWRESGCCEVCGEKLGFLERTFSKKCKNHR